MNPSLSQRGNFSKQHNKQSGAALIIFFLVLMLAGSAVLFSVFDGNSVKIERNKKTEMALGQAKAALVGYATAVDLSGAARPGDMPCPDLDNDGIAESSCGNAAGTTQQANRIGRFPWKTLGVSDLRDGYGERLWYAVSNNFKNNTRTACAFLTPAGCLNSDSGGTITVRDSSGTVIKNGSTGTGAAAVIFSPGPSITRQDALVQDRSCTVGTNCDAANVCTTSPASSTPKCNASNYLDILVGTEDNADFADSSATNGFIYGSILDVNGAPVVNDSMAVVSVTDLMPTLEKRVAKEVLNCLEDYALNNSGGLNRHPSSTDKSATYPSYADSANLTNRRFGRVPDTAFTQTQSISSNAMSGSWTGSCKIVSTTGWWPNWKELVFYALADLKDPNTIVAGVCSSLPSYYCLTINTPSGAQTQQKVAVIIAGKALTGQLRDTNVRRQSLSNYLEGENISTAGMNAVNVDGEDVIFEQKPATATFNDVVVFY